MSIEKQTLYVVATPIGNLRDISERAREVLAAVDVIAAEDTRHSRHLLNHYGMQTRLLALHEHNEQQAGTQLLEQLRAGGSAALISDAGTPLISDPGARLLSLAHQQSIRVVPIPGPSALISALSVAGLPADRFVFEGFLSAKTKARQERLDALREETRTLVFYEAPHRILDCLQALAASFGAEREAVLVKEITKLFETVRRDSLAALHDWLSAEPERQKGEFVMVVAGAATQRRETGPSPDAMRVLRLLREELPLKQAVKLAAAISGEHKNSLYQAALSLEKGEKG